MVKQLLTSKRTWVVVVGAAGLVMNKMGFIVTEADQQVLIDGALQAATAIAVVVTKIMDEIVERKVAQ